MDTNSEPKQDEPAPRLDQALVKELLRSARFADGVEVSIHPLNSDIEPPPPIDND